MRLGECIAAGTKLPPEIEEGNVEYKVYMNLSDLTSPTQH
jgi:hypothetical protein